MASPHLDPARPLQEARRTVLQGLNVAATLARARGLPVGEPEGQLLRPLVAFAALRPVLRPRVDDRFWLGALAIQMVHEASLLHDDILDGADSRRGSPTLAARKGIGAALVRGDHLLTGAYRVAASAGLPGFLHTFIRAVERTVAGEIAQQARIGGVLTPPEYRAVIEGKSGALFGAAVALAAEWSGEPGPPDPETVGGRIGALYQMIDDTLDYCPAVETGKPTLQDYTQGKWTFVLDTLGLEDFTLHASDVLARLFEGREGEGVGAARVLVRLESEARQTLEGVPHDDGLMAQLLGSWVDRARQAVEWELARSPLSSEPSPSGTRPSRQQLEGWSERIGRSNEAEVAELARDIGPPGEWGRYFGLHSKSFRFASRLFPPAPRRSIEGVYAFCRFTDDLVDETDVEAARARARIEAWRGLAEAAYDGVKTGIPLADEVMGEAAREGVPFHYVDELLSGVAMDLDPVHFERVADLEVYTYRVASVVGGWVSELFGVRDPEVLVRAYRLGHAMQYTNILRDVGEDWRADRLYLPRDLMDSHGVDLATIDRVASGRGPVPRPFAELCETFVSLADRHYEAAFEAIPELPPFFARPVAVAARVYQGIHDEIRRMNYDHGTRRAHTGIARKLRLGLGGLIDLRRMNASPRIAGARAIVAATEVDR